MRYFVFLIFLISSQGCGKVFLGDTQKVEINVTPAEAQIKIPDRIQEVTSLSIELPRDESHLVEISKPGYVTKWIVLKKEKLPSVIIAELLLTLGIGLLVDIYWGTWEGLSPSKLEVVLEPVQTGGIPIEVPLLLAKSGLTTEDPLIKIQIHQIR